MSKQSSKDLFEWYAQVALHNLEKIDPDKKKGKASIIVKIVKNFVISCLMFIFLILVYVRAVDLGVIFHIKEIIVNFIQNYIIFIEL